MWTIPKNLEGVYNKWASKLSPITKQPTEWILFYRWVADGGNRPIPDAARPLLRDFGHPWPYVRVKPPPPALKVRLDELMQKKQRRTAKQAVADTSELSKLAEQQQKQLQQCQETMRKMQEEREQLLNRIRELEKRTKCPEPMLVVPPQPIPVVVDPAETEKVVKKSQESGTSLLDQIRQGKKLKSVQPPAAVPTPPPSNAWNTSILNRRGAMGYTPETENDDSSEWEDENAQIRARFDRVINSCSVCRKPAKGECGNCQKRKYCGAECQKKDWETYRHEKLCKPNQTRK